MRLGLAWACLLAACGGPGPDRPTLAQSLLGSWYHASEFRAGEFIRSGSATLGVDRASIRYAWNILWECAAEPCAAPPPKDSGGYFEGVYRDLGDSLALQDGVDALGFREVGDSAFTFLVNGAAFPMRRR